jgi:hypothetical protein
MKSAMPPAIGLLAVLAIASASARARAYDGPLDVETDHMDAFDDVGPRSFGVFATSSASGLGSFGVKLGAGVDLALGDRVALSFRADWLVPPGQVGRGLSVGAPIFVSGIPFHGLYLEPRIDWEHYASDDLSLDASAVGLDVGWEWTWRGGFTVRVALGGSYTVPLGGGAGDDERAAYLGPKPHTQAEVGWVF